MTKTLTRPFASALLLLMACSSSTSGSMPLRDAGNEDPVDSGTPPEEDDGDEGDGRDPTDGSPDDGANGDGTEGPDGSNDDGASDGSNDDGSNDDGSEDGSTGDGDGDPMPEEGDITALRAAREMGKGLNLGQMFENTQHPRTFEAAKAKIDAYHARGFRNVRIPVTWTDEVDGTLLVHDANVGEVNRQHPRLAVITRIIDYALSLEGMYVVLNAHHERQLKHNSRGAVLERLWQDIVDLYKDRSHRLVFEILNEPHREDANKSPMPAADLRDMTGKAYRKIRAVDSARIVIIGGNQWFGYGEMANVWPNLDAVGGGNDGYVMSTFHHYNPWTFCGDNQGDYADNWANSDMINPMDVMRQWADGVGRGMPVYIGEWGVGWGSRLQTMECNNIRLWYQMFDHDIAGPKGMPTSVWDDGGWFKVFDHGTNQFANNLIDCLATGTCDWQTGERLNAACR